jgi:hypothetical protein
MIKFEYTNSNDHFPEGKTLVKIDDNVFFCENQIPLRLVQKNLMGKVIWSTDLYPEWFSEYPMNTHTTIEIIDSIGNTLLNWKWDPFIHGDYCHQSFELWALNNRGSNGIAIGTHDGMTGEWVGPVNKGLLKASLVEPSSYQFNELIKLLNVLFATFTNFSTGNFFTVSVCSGLFFKFSRIIFLLLILFSKVKTLVENKLSRFS